jgi:hypothetical protein
MLLGPLLAVLLVQVPRVPAIPGAVVDDQGKPVAGAQVVLYAPPMTWGKANTVESQTTTDAEGRFQLERPPLGRRIVNDVSILAYRAGMTIAATSIFRHPDKYVLRKPDPRPIKVEGPDGRPIAGARIAPRIVNIFDWSPVNVPESLADPLIVTTGPDGQAVLQYLTARDQLVAARVTTDSIGTQDILLVEQPGQGSTEPVITIRLKKTSRLSGRIVDETRKPVAGQVVEIWSLGGGWLRPNAVALMGGPLHTGTDGSFQTPDNLMVGSSYRIAVRGPGKETVLSDWMTIGEQPRALLPMRLRSLRAISGLVVDRQGKPVAGVEVFQTGDGPEPTSTRSGPDGRFTLGGYPPGPVFLFARADGFRFHGQLIRGDERNVTVELTRKDERPARTMHILPEPIPLAESRAMARRLAEPVWKAIAATGNDRRKFDTLEALANVDPAGTLEKLESARFASTVWDFRLRTTIALAMAEGDPEEAAGVAESIADPGPRAAALIKLVDALPAAQRDRRLALLDRAAPHARAEPDAAKRLELLGDVAERWYNLGEVEKARALFAEGVKIAAQMPDKKKSERAYFAVQLAVVDPEAALAIARDFKGVRVGGSWKTVWGLEVIARDSSDGVFFWRATNRLPKVPSYASFAWALALVDPARAQRIIGGIPMLSQLSETPVYLALAELGRNEAAVGPLLDEALRRIDRRMQEPPGGVEPSIAYILPVVERIDPALVAEFFWREVAYRQAYDNPRTTSLYSPIDAIRLLAWYDREVAAALFEPTRERIERTQPPELATWRSQFLVWSHFDPRAAAARLENVPVRDDPAPDANAARIEVAASLGQTFEQRLKPIWSYREYVFESTKQRP